MIGKIQGTGAYVPPKILENQQLEKWVETNDTWIRERTGVQKAQHSWQHRQRVRH